MSIHFCLPTGKYTTMPTVHTDANGNTGGTTEFQPFVLPVGCQECIQLTVHKIWGIGPVVEGLNGGNVCTPNSSYALEEVARATAGNSITDVSYQVGSGTPVQLYSGPLGVFDLHGTTITGLQPCLNTVTITAKDNHNLPFSTTIGITVDADPPQFTACANVTATTFNINGGQVAVSPVTATDNCNPPWPPTLSYNPPLFGNTFHLGVTTVTCTAEDQCHNINTCQFTVTVPDCTAIMPVLTCDANKSVECGNALGL